MFGRETVFLSGTFRGEDFGPKFTEFVVDDFVSGWFCFGSVTSILPSKREDTVDEEVEVVSGSED